ncbi:hypothetical protein LPJ79_001759 [Coemansia sp. RSA 1821]|nr:S-adenosyl-L-methionine-dependent methyltransferase [Coemansia mojavensis]KAJ1743811.1 hypothetical protein LPJ68_000618 [Coemansia sp. RSA 1086]KAJ1751800.1 hypothetical protein LPJ79_001759 [Coemansia sp. RSA 1821]KAJ2674056.1 hypothetical protein IWW42_001876 [Coemansia sp. RSA 1085]
MTPYFWPAMWEQRRICIAQTLYQHRAQKVLDVGCGEGNMLAFLVAPGPNDEHPVEQLYGIDIDADALAVARDRLLPDEADRRDLRVDPLSVRLFHGNATVPICGISPDAVVCSEVIEHISETEEVPALTRAILGSYRPHLAVFTTPNAEFNVNFPALAYGTPSAQLRHSDHKFEWTREQFGKWAAQAASTFGYTVELRGIGFSMRNATDDFKPSGGCSQMAVFVRKEPGGLDPTSSTASEEMPRLFAQFEYPVYLLPVLEGQDLLTFVQTAARSICDNQRVFQVAALWDVLEVKQQFKRLQALHCWLEARACAFAPLSVTTASKDHAYQLI